MLPKAVEHFVQGPGCHEDHEEVRSKIQSAIGEYELLTLVKKRKLRWFGHVSRSSGLATLTILQSTVKGKEAANVTGTESDSSPSTTTFCLRLLRKAGIQRRVEFRMP